MDLRPPDFAQRRNRNAWPEKTAGPHAELSVTEDMKHQGAESPIRNSRAEIERPISAGWRHPNNSWLRSSKHSPKREWAGHERAFNYQRRRLARQAGPAAIKKARGSKNHLAGRHNLLGPHETEGPKTARSGSTSTGCRLTRYEETAEVGFFVRIGATGSKKQ